MTPKAYRPQVRLPGEVRKALAAWPGATALATEADGAACILLKCDRADALNTRQPGVKVMYQPQAGLYPTGPVMRLYAEIRDRPGAPLVFETFLDPASAYDLALLRKFARQEHLDFHLFDMGLTYIYTKRIAVKTETRADLAGMIDQALEHLASIPAERRNFPTARDAMMQDTEV